MTDVAVYPITARNSFMLSGLRKIRKDLNITCAVVPNAYRKVEIGEDLLVVHNIEEVPCSIKCIIFLSMWDKQRMFKEMSHALQAGISIVCADDIPQEKQQTLYEIADQANTTCEFYDSNLLFTFLSERSDVFTPQESVVVAVGSLTKGINTSKTIIDLYCELTEMGYRVGVIASDPELQLFKFWWLPIQKVIDKDLDDSVIQINRLANYFQLTQRVDVILVQLPDEGLYRVANEYETCFGVGTFLVSQAIDIDYSVMLLPAMSLELESFNFLNTTFMYRYGFEMDSVCVTHNTIDFGAPQGTKEMKYFISTDADVETLAAELQEGEQRVFVDTNTNWCKEVANDIVKNLS